jgi:hypothetical protein
MKSFIVSVAIAILASTSLAAQDSSERINLVCRGAGAANKVTSSQAYAWDNYGNSASANVVGNRSVPFQDQVNLWIEGDKGSIRMPPTMLPPIRGGKDGWFEIKSIKISDSEITGKVGVNFMNSPKIRIDRMTGNISISGKAGDYVGRCQKYDPATATRAF